MNLYTKYYNEFLKQYMMYIPLTIILQSCIGSIAAMFILMNTDYSMLSFFQLFTCVILCMFYNGAVLAQLKGKMVFNLLLMSILFNTLFIIINLL